VTIIKNKIIPEIDLEKYNYVLPKHRIAEFPLENRCQSKLLCVNKKTGVISHRIFKDIAYLIPNESLIIFNNTKVIPARLNLIKETGGAVELLCVEPSGATRDPQIAMQDRSESKWVCIVGGKKVTIGKVLQSVNKELFAEIIERYENKAIVRFFWKSGESFAEIIEKIGSVPLPPYIKREPVKIDNERYQTCYANYNGSVAAPTAGLHFTKDIINSIANNRNTLANVTLHVGPGTFKPIDSSDIICHDMHNEMIIVQKAEIEKILNYLRSNEKPSVIAVGTTSVRTIETLYWIGTLYYHDKLIINDGEVFLDQWLPYEIVKESKVLNAVDSFQSLLEFMVLNSIDVLKARTKLFIIPGYDFRVVTGIITNFHMPKSTLILLVAAFLGDELWRESYRVALGSDYRFLSYGDSSFFY
jgi:S-adenosylmethionine:tRNA ribosyltransferase-isomerase